MNGTEAATSGTSGTEAATSATPGTEAAMSGMAAQPERLHVTWADLESLVERLASDIRGDFDCLLAVTRGGLVPTGMLAYRLGIRNILVAAVAFYDNEGQPGTEPSFLEFPADPVLHGRRILVVDEVWDTGTTIAAVVERIRLAGGVPTTAVLHYKPARSRVDLVPDHHAVTTDAWVVYPFKYGR